MTAEIENALDARHAEARAAFFKRDADAYADIFTDDLVYRRHDGETLSRARLMQNVRDQLRKLDRVDSQFLREALIAKETEATETLTQTATGGVTVFGLLHRDMRVARRGHYTWRSDGDQWRICRVEILSEDVTSKWRFGL